MTVGHLIQYLKEYPLDASVFINPLLGQREKSYMKVLNKNIVIVEKQDLAEWNRYNRL